MRWKDFFIQCDNLADWLGKDPATNFTKLDARNFMRCDTDLNICSLRRLAAETSGSASSSGMLLHVPARPSRPRCTELCTRPVTCCVVADGSAA